MKKDRPIEERPIEEIETDVIEARKLKAKLPWNPVDIASDMLVVTKLLQKDLEKFIKKGMESPNRRARALSKLLETLGKNFRVQSTKENKNAKNR